MNAENNIRYQQFEGFAQYYDMFMLRLVNYQAWVDYIIKIFNHYHYYPKSILDVACGTGIPSLIFAKKGYQVVGVDRSLAMLEVFRSKIKNTNYNVQIIHSDIRSFTVSEKLDAAVSLYDSLNYLLTEDDLLACFRCVANSLKPNGIFAFDMNTIYCLENFWNNQETTRRIGDVFSIWRNSYDPIQQISTLKLTVYTDDGRVFEELHQERGYSEAVIKTLLAKAGFTEINIYAHQTFLPAVEATLRIMVVSRLTDNLNFV
ncbi:MAG: class I SAM-dependent methyltransferase [candidate division WOR-3 bacterium]|nr:class I SAM-dependent methyltransferase [candidate division WOR-3 bacterium]